MRKMLASAILVGLTPVAAVACNALVGLPSPVSTEPNDAGGQGYVGSVDAGALPAPIPRDGGEDQPDVSIPASNDAGGEAGREGGACDGVDLTSSAKNCGACGHDCAGARCSASLCEMVPIAGSPLEERGLWSLYGLTLLQGMLYGTDWYRAYSAVYAVPPNASVTQPQALVSYGMSASADAITNDGNQLYFSIFQDETTPVPNGSAGVYALGANGTPVRIYSGGYVDQLAADAGHVYWSDHNKYVYSAKADGSQLQTFLTTTSASPVVASGGWVYFVTSGAIVRAQPTSLAQYTVVSDVGTPTAFDVGTSDVFWFDGASGVLRARSLSLAAPSVDITPPAGVAPPSGDAPIRLMVGAPDSGNLYLLTTSTQSGEIYRLKANASSPAQLLVHPNDGIYALTQSGTTLFFTTYGSGVTQAPFSAVFRVEKPAL